MRFSTDCSRCFAGLSCGTRIEIVNLLRDRKRLTVSEIARHFEVTQPTVTHHLQYLKTMGILKSKKEGRKVYYFLDPKCGWNNCNIFV